jgi:hypothetical protein
MRKSYLTDFAKGILIGLIAGIIVVGLAAGIVYRHKKDKELIEYAEKQIEIEMLREDIINRDPAEFLEEPGVRRAADGARTEFDRKRDEALQRFRN